jgi:hypothetical protein
MEGGNYKMVKSVLLIVVTIVFVITPMSFAANLWNDDFSDGKINAAYKTPSSGGGAAPPKWVEEQGVIKQTESRPGDPTYCAMELPKDIEFCGQLVRIRFDEWQDHDRSRAGVGFWLDPAGAYQGYTTVIHNSLTSGNYQFLNDARGWHGTIVNFNTGGVNSWFWMKSEINLATKKMVGKVWTGELKDEPKSWMNEVDYTTFGAVRNPTRWVGLNGGAGTTAGFSKVSFDEWYVYDSAGIDLTKAVEYKNKLALTWGKVKE